ncbi:MAG: GNAT family N-acetyltransferase [Acidobacteriota bacterium]
MTKTAPVVREHRPEDIPQIEACLVELQEFERGLQPRLAEGRAIASRYVAHMLKRCAETKGGVYVAEVDGDIAGFATVWTHMKSEPILEREFEYAYVSDLYVRPKYRRQGLATALMARIEAHARERGVDLVRLMVLARNDLARPFYDACGYREEEITLCKPLKS